ncbi:hypothetical protein HMPREF9019_2158 [Hoylesella timonensis CRIS 5C-B1]|uniref:Uncharacterized protein n=1 Tax=Hoylesella timonensis CRIS 5C-B1 TaxID=679189 RepID=D1VWN3_9BACT|nr:hypothetical protein HMPREF9019_2158 [Hoylesella timonensis CRIS 5C-B1]
MKFTLNFTPKNVKLGVFFFILVRIHTLHIYTWTHCWEQQTHKKSALLLKIGGFICFDVNLDKIITEEEEDVLMVN